MGKIEEVNTSRDLNHFKLDAWTKAGKWLITTFKPYPSRDAWYLTALKTSAIIIAATALAIPTLGLGLVPLLYALYKGSRITTQQPQHQEISPNPSGLLVGPENAIHTTKVAKLYPTRPDLTVCGIKEIPLPSPTVNLPPIGIYNGGNDCYFSAGVQLIMNTPSLLEIAKKIGETNEFYEKLISDYQECQKHNGTMETGEGSAYREFKNHMHKRHGRFPPCQQGDTEHLIDAFWGDAGEIEDKTLTQGIRRQLLSSLDETTYTDAFREIHDIGAEDEYKSPSPPENFIFSQNVYLSKRNNFLSLTAEADLFQNQQSARYECTYFDLYFARKIEKVNTGHYWCCLKVNNQWYVVNDDAVEKIDTPIGRISDEMETRISHFARIR